MADTAQDARIVSYDLEIVINAPKVTVFKVEDAILGRVADPSVSRLQEGWQTLFGDGLKVYVENR